MLPIILDPSKLTIGLAGEGDAWARRVAHLADAGLEPLRIGLGDFRALEGLDVLYVAGGEPEAVEALATRAKALGVLVNVEDKPALCDFHVPATVRRGDLLVTVSSAGRSPGLVRAVREWLSAQFGPEWRDRVAQAGNLRAGWRADGLAPKEISSRTRALVSAWLP